jgi:predicted ABC-type sugar transport system permease subunit
MGKMSELASEMQEKEFLKLENNYLIEELEKQRERFEDKSDWNPTKHRDQTRSRIAIIFVACYFAFLGAGLIWIPLYNLWSITAIQSTELVLNFKDTFLAISSAVGSSLGFVIGYYFKGAERINQ